MPVATKVPKPEPVSIGSKLRKSNAWFENIATRAKDDATKERRKKERAKGPLLSEKDLSSLADELEEIQRQLNPLESRRKEILERLLPHWGHTGLEEIESSLGKTLVSTSYELYVDPDVIKEKVSNAAWLAMTARILQAPLLLAKGKDATEVRDAAAKAIVVKRMKVSITSPSSRRPKSGEAGDIEDEAA